MLLKLDCERHQWAICNNIKMISILLGQQCRYTKFPCFLCLWDSRAKDKHNVKKVWPVRKQHVPGKNNILYKNLVDLKKILLPPLHKKLGLMKQFVKALNKKGNFFQYLFLKFPHISEAK